MIARPADCGACIATINGKPVSRVTVTPGTAEIASAYVITGAGFGDTPGGVYLSGPFNARPELRVDNWSDTRIVAYFPRGLLGETDRDGISLSVRLPDGRLIQTPATARFYAARQEQTIGFDAIPRASLRWQSDTALDMQVRDGSLLSIDPVVRRVRWSPREGDRGFFHQQGIDQRAPRRDLSRNGRESLGRPVEGAGRRRLSTLYKGHRPLNAGVGGSVLRPSSTNLRRKGWPCGGATSRRVGPPQAGADISSRALPVSTSPRTRLGSHFDTAAISDSRHGLHSSGNGRCMVTLNKGSPMSEKPSPSTLRLLVEIILGASVCLIALAIWMIVKDEGSPVFVAVAGSMLAAFAAIIGSQANKTP